MNVADCENEKIMNNLTLVIPSYNNLPYLKLCYESIREASKDVQLILMDDGSSDGTADWLRSLEDENIIVHTLPNRVGHTILYDVGFMEARTDYIGILHADMVVAPNFFDKLLPRLERGKVISARCIEPPLHPEGAEKIVKNFGMTGVDFNREAFSTFALEQPESTMPSLFAPWFIHRDDYFEKVGGHDLQFAPYGYEDSDLFVRMIKAGFEPTQYGDLLVYHFTQRGHKWNNGTVGKFNDDYQLQMHITRNRFLNKWGTLMWKNEQHTPTDIPLYYKQLTIKNYDMRESRIKYEFLNFFFNKVITENGQVIKTDGRDASVNYEIIFDYASGYDSQQLQTYMMHVPGVVRNCEVGTYEEGGIIFDVLNTHELRMGLSNG